MPVNPSPSYHYSHQAPPTLGCDVTPSQRPSPWTPGEDPSRGTSIFNLAFFKRHLPSHFHFSATRSFHFLTLASSALHQHTDNIVQQYKHMWQTEFCPGRRPTAPKLGNMRESVDIKYKITLIFFFFFSTNQLACNLKKKKMALKADVYKCTVWSEAAYRIKQTYVCLKKHLLQHYRPPCSTLTG